MFVVWGVESFAFTTEDSRRVYLAKLKEQEGQYTLTWLKTVGNADVLYRPVCLVWKAKDEVYVSDLGPPAGIETKAQAGVKMVSFEGKAGYVDILSEQCGQPFGIARSKSHGVVVSDTKTDRLLAIDEKRVVSVAGAGERKTVDGTGNSGHFNQPKGIAMTGDVAFVVCEGDNSLRLFSESNAQVRFMAEVLLFARIHGILDPSDRRSADKRAIARGTTWTEYESKLKELCDKRTAWAVERRDELGLKKDTAALKGPEGIVPFSSSIRAWNQNLQSATAISKYITDIGCAEYIAYLDPAQNNDMPVEHIFAGQALTAYDRKEDQRSYTSNRDANRFEKLKASCSDLQFAYVTDPKSQYHLTRPRFVLSEQELREGLLGPNEAHGAVDVVLVVRLVANLTQTLGGR